MLKIVLIGDNEFAFDKLVSLLIQFNEVHITGKFNNSLEAFNSIKKTPPHAVFVEIELPDLDGFAVAEEIYSLNETIDVVFTSHHSRYAVKAFEFGISDFLLRPYTLQRLRTTVRRLLKSKESYSSHSQVGSSMLGYLNAPSPFDQEGWFNTQDVVLQKGDYVKILGRETELINVGGQKVYPAEVESVLMEIDNVRDVSVWGEKNPYRGTPGMENLAHVSGTGFQHPAPKAGGGASSGKA